LDVEKEPQSCLFIPPWSRCWWFLFFFVVLLVLLCTTWILLHVTWTDSYHAAFDLSQWFCVLKGVLKLSSGPFRV
jgi:hypothetical protein